MDGGTAIAGPSNGISHVHHNNNHHHSVQHQKQHVQLVANQQQQLPQQPENDEAPYHSQVRPLFHTSCLIGDEETVVKLIAAGAKVDDEDFAGCTPIQLASAAGHLNIVKLLLQNGAKPEKQDSSCETLGSCVGCLDAGCAWVTKLKDSTPTCMSLPLPKGWYFKITELSNETLNPCPVVPSEGISLIMKLCLIGGGISGLFLLGCCSGCCYFYWRNRRLVEQARNSFQQERRRARAERHRQLEDLLAQRERLVEEDEDVWADAEDGEEGDGGNGGVVGENGENERREIGVEREGNVVEVQDAGEGNVGDNGAGEETGGGGEQVASLNNVDEPQEGGAEEMEMEVFKTTRSGRRY